MKFEESPDLAEVLLRRAHAARERLHPREPGLHASDLIFCLKKAWYKNGGADTYPAPEPSLADLTLWITGSGHHAVLEAIGSEPGVITEQSRKVALKIRGDTVVMHVTPDVIDHDKTMVEIKSTRKSSAAEWHELSYYIEQLAWYTAVWGYVRGVLYVLYLVGNYKESRGAILKAYEIEFTPEELKAWTLEMASRAELAVGERAPNPWRYAWECGYCPYASARGGPCDQDVLAKGRDGDKSYIKQTGFFGRET